MSSEPFTINRYVPQGCLMSAHLFNLGNEPLLQRIQKCKRIRAERDKNLLPMLMSYYFGRLVAQKIHNTSIERV